AGRALDDQLPVSQHRADVAPAPRVGEDEGRNVGPRGDEQLDVVLADLVLPGPDRELLDLAGQLLQVFTDELDQRAGDVGGRLDPVACELLPGALRRLLIR